MCVTVCVVAVSNMSMCHNSRPEMLLYVEDALCISVRVSMRSKEHLHHFQNHCNCIVISFSNFNLSVLITKVIAILIITIINQHRRRHYASAYNLFSEYFRSFLVVM